MLFLLQNEKRRNITTWVCNNALLLELLQWDRIYIIFYIYIFLQQFLNFRRKKMQPFDRQPLEFSIYRVVVECVHDISIPK